MTPRKAVIESIECLQNELDLVDIWRAKNPETKSDTWNQKSPAIFCRLDYWLISNNLCDYVQSTGINPAVKTDHAAIDLCISDIVDEVKGPGMWKLNVSLLDDKDYLKDLEQNVPKCWNLICNPFFDCVNASFEKEELSNSQKQAVITLIEKKGKDRTLLENWRPISLVNVDAQIISKAIANRIKKVLPNIVHHNQSGYMKDRFIGETARSSLDVMDFTKRENLPGLLIFIDF